MLPSPRSLCSLQDRPTNLRDEELRQRRDFIVGGVEWITDGEDGRLAPQNTHLTGVWTPGSFLGQRREGEEAK